MKYVLLVTAMLISATAYAQEAVAPLPAEPAIPIEGEPLVGEEVATQKQEELGGAFYRVAKLQGLNKVTARISEIEAPLGVAVWFGSLDVIVEQCWQAPPEALPENAALLSIRENKPDEAPETVFHGWMFSSSPSLSGLEHPVYDVTVLECMQKPLGEENPPADADAAPTGAAQE